MQNVFHTVCSLQMAILNQNNGLKVCTHIQHNSPVCQANSSKYQLQNSAKEFEHIITRIAEHAIIYIPKQFPHQLLMNSSPGGRLQAVPYLTTSIMLCKKPRKIDWQSQDDKSKRSSTYQKNIRIRGCLEDRKNNFSMQFCHAYNLQIWLLITSAKVSRKSANVIRSQIGRL